MMTPEEIQARVVYIDGMVIVLNKPAGLAVHGGPGNGAHLGPWLEALKYGKQRRPELAHRLDRDTTGCLVLGRHPKALRLLHELFEGARVKKTYWALVCGVPKEGEGRIELPLLHDKGLTRVDASGQCSITNYRTLGTVGEYTWLELQPQTGRTHQLRIHCATLGCPIVGDVRYGAPAADAVYLHAREVDLPVKREPVTVMAPLPEVWEKFALQS
jgi:tRNA pseudouridine32 synthase/23S rRNA pseudouridine746 synthase